MRNIAYNDATRQVSEIGRVSKLQCGGIFIPLSVGVTQVTTVLYKKLYGRTMISPATTNLQHRKETARGVVS